MKTRNLLVSLIALMAILIASCSEQQPGTGMEVSGTKTLTFRLTTDGQAQTRAAAPSVTGHKLQYILQVLDAGGNILPTYTQTVETGTFDVTLPLGVAYTCLFWAQYIPDAGGVSEFFDTNDLKAVALKKPLTADDQCQAFCATASVAAADEALTHTVVMKRAVAQVNIKSDTQMTGYSKLTAAYTNVPNTFNVLDNTVTTIGGVSGDANFEITSFSSTPGADGKYICQSAYFLASANGAGSMLNIALDTYITAAPGAVFKTITVNNAPTKKNVRTNVLINFAATSSTYTYTLDFVDFDMPDTDHRPPSNWNGVSPAPKPDAPFGGGDGSQANPYIIGSATDLAQLEVNTTNNVNYSDKYFKLDVDIDLNNHPWRPIAPKGDKPFGTFDGQHHKITGLNVDISAIGVEVGLFGVVAGGVSNLHVAGAVKSTGAGCNVGGICGSAKPAYGVTCVLANCSFAGSVEGTSALYIGGIMGNYQNTVVITSCKNTGTVKTNNEYADVGGIAGRGDSGILFVFGCYNEGTITGGAASGIVTNGATISGCYNIGAVSGSQSGGQAAISGGTASVSECYVKETIGTDSGGETVFGDGAWPTSTNNTVWFAAPDNDGTYTKAANDEPTGDYKFWKSLGSWNGGTPQHPKLWWEE